MNKYKNSIYWIVIALFLFVTGYLSFVSHKNYILYDNQRLDLIISNNRIKVLTYKYKKELGTQNTKLKDLCLKDTSNNEVFISSLIESPKLIFRFSSQSCGPCVDRIRENLENVANGIGDKNIIVIADYPNLRSLKVLMQNWKISCHYFNYTNHFGLIIENMESSRSVPFCIVVDKDLTLSYPYLADESAEMDSAYFNKIKEYFQKSPSK